LDDVLNTGKFPARIKVTPGIDIFIGKAAEAIALHYRDIFDGGMRFALGAFIVFGGSVGHALNQFLVSGWGHQTVNFQKFQKAAAQSSQGSSQQTLICPCPEALPDQVLCGNTQRREKSFKLSKKKAAA